MLYIILGINEDNPLWIGAWWKGCVIVGTFLLLIAPFVILFPPVIPVPGNKHTDAENVQKELEEDETPSTLGDWWNEICNVGGRLCRNKIYTLHVLATTFIIAAVVGFATFLPKYIEYMFRKRATTSIVGPASQSGAAVIGLLLMGLVVSKWKPRARTYSCRNLIL